MTSDLKNKLREQLQRIGYEFFDEADGGWEWEIGEFSSRTVRLAFDSEAEALADALDDFASRFQELSAAAAEVVNRWERGDLAEAVRELAAAIDAMSPRAGAAATAALPPKPKTPVLWLVHGSTKGEAWVDAAYRDREAAIAAGLSEARQWSDSFRIDAEALANELRQGRSALIGGEGSEIWITVETIEVCAGGLTAPSL